MAVSKQVTTCRHRPDALRAHSIFCSCCHGPLVVLHLYFTPTRHPISVEIFVIDDHGSPEPRTAANFSLYELFSSSNLRRWSSHMQTKEGVRLRADKSKKMNYAYLLREVPTRTKVRDGKRTNYERSVNIEDYVLSACWLSEGSRHQSCEIYCGNESESTDRQTRRSGSFPCSQGKLCLQSARKIRPHEYTSDRCERIPHACERGIQTNRRGRTASFHLERLFPEKEYAERFGELRSRSLFRPYGRFWEWQRSGIRVCKKQRVDKC